MLSGFQRPNLTWNNLWKKDHLQQKLAVDTFYILVLYCRYFEMISILGGFKFDTLIPSHAGINGVEILIWQNFLFFVLHKLLQHVNCSVSEQCPDFSFGEHLLAPINVENGLQSVYVRMLLGLSMLV